MVVLVSILEALQGVMCCADIDNGTLKAQIALSVALPCRAFGALIFLYSSLIDCMTDLSDAANARHHGASLSAVMQPAKLWAVGCPLMSCNIMHLVHDGALWHACGSLSCHLSESSA